MAIKYLFKFVFAKSITMCIFCSQLNLNCFIECCSAKEVFIMLWWREWLVRLRKHRSATGELKDNMKLRSCKCGEKKIFSMLKWPGLRQASSWCVTDNDFLLWGTLSIICAIFGGCLTVFVKVLRMIKERERISSVYCSSSQCWNSINCAQDCHG